MISDDELNRLEALDKAATPGPWEFLGPLKTVTKKIDVGQVATGDVQTVCVAIDKADGEFVVAARTALPALIAEVRRLRRAGLRLAWCAVCEEDRVTDATGHWVCGHDKED